MPESLRISCPNDEIFKHLGGGGQLPLLPPCPPPPPMEENQMQVEKKMTPQGTEQIKEQGTLKHEIFKKNDRGERNKNRANILRTMFRVDRALAN